MNEPELRFKADDGSEFPEWVEFKFLDLLESIIDFRGRTPKKLGMDWANHKTNHLALSAVNVKMGYIDIDNDPHYGDDALYDKWMHGRELHKGQVLFTTEAPMGNVAQVPNNEPYILSQRTIALNPKQDLINENFLTALLGSPTVQNKLEILATGGTAQGVSQKSLSHLSVKIPCLIEQQKIADLFSTLDNVINSAQKEVDSWEQMKRGVMQKLFSQEVRFKADDGSEFPEWGKVSVGDLTLSHKQGYYTDKAYVENGIKLARVSDLFNPNINYSTMPMINISEKDYESFKVRPGDFLIARSGSIGRYGIVNELPEDTKVIFGSFLIRFNFDSKLINNRYFGEFYDSFYAYEQLLKITQAGANININAENIKKIIVPLPCLEEQQKIADCLSEFDLVIEKTRKKLEAYKQLKKGLMQQMFI